ncbi:replication-associated recombination protein A [Puniceicoccales bacterium CK1056]|uniref:Replication-associated recombination protein A n=1 Tax=Oceanipulchritudo coccoides TaxID=2706888 RepID=A0A6B2LZU8_9BACT|nr:replication-associated recombination protein A [Oceanipulchritudo coccoides]NDV61973.1 replication-associated recombination protein A [Oceanipulchritudo coccoides]
MPERDQKEFFTADAPKASASSESPGYRPLAARMRPRNLKEVVGQDHILGEGCLLPKLVKADRFGSLLFYGPPGTGKTSLAQAIADETGSRFVQVNAVLSNTAEMRDILRMARYRPEERTILFIDEIHRFNKAQQDLLLPDVEAGHIRLIGATTHNPGFYVNAPLLSRSHLFKLEPVSGEAIVSVLKRALADDVRGLGAMRVQADDDILGRLARMSDGDLRRALNSLETIVLSLDKPGGDRQIEQEDLEAFASERQIRYDANEDEHYDTASAFIKSMRGSDPDASLYWLAKMLSGGEDPRFIARRLVIFASEDVGLADPRALPMAVACKSACEFVGLPECQLNLAHVTVFLATCPKSNSTTIAIGNAMKSIKEKGMQPVPLWLKDAHTKFNKSLGHGKDYKYSHDFPEANSGQEFMENPEQFYFPKDAGLESRIKEHLEKRRRKR